MPTPPDTGAGQFPNNNNKKGLLRRIIKHQCTITAEQFSSLCSNPKREPEYVLKEISERL